MGVYLLMGAEDKIRRVVARFGLDTHSLDDNGLRVWIDDEELDDVEDYARTLGVKVLEI
jgi:hypothetical protein